MHNISEYEDPMTIWGPKLSPDVSSPCLNLPITIDSPWLTQEGRFASAMRDHEVTFYLH